MHGYDDIVFSFDGSAMRFSWNAESTSTTTSWTSRGSDMHDELNQSDQLFFAGDHVRVLSPVLRQPSLRGKVIGVACTPNETTPYFTYHVAFVHTNSDGVVVDESVDVIRENHLELLRRTNTRRKGYYLALHKLLGKARVDALDREHLRWFMLGIAVLELPLQVLRATVTAIDNARTGPHVSQDVLALLAHALQKAPPREEAGDAKWFDWRDYKHGNVKVLVFLQHHPRNGEQFRNEFPRILPELSDWVDHVAPCVVRACYEKWFGQQTFGYAPLLMEKTENGGRPGMRDKIAKVVTEKWAVAVGDASPTTPGYADTDAKNSNNKRAREWETKKRTTLKFFRAELYLHEKRRLFASVVDRILADLDAGPAESRLFHFEEFDVGCQVRLQRPLVVFKPVYEIDVSAYDAFESMFRGLRSATVEGTAQRWKKDRANAFMAKLPGAGCGGDGEKESDILRLEADDACRGVKKANKEQLANLNIALTAPFTLLYGPPGTGKTSFGLSQIVRFYRNELNYPAQAILCVTPTGKAFKSLCNSLETALNEEEQDEGGDGGGDEDDEDEDDEDEDDEDDEDEDDEDDEEAGDENADFLRGEASLRRHIDVAQQEDSRARPPPQLAAAIENARRKVYQELGYVDPRGRTGRKKRSSAIYNARLSGTLERLSRLCRHASKSLETLDTLAAASASRKATAAAAGLVVIVDELSMFSSSMFRCLLLCLEKLEQRAGRIEKVVFCGDEKQLASIEHGNVLGNLLAYPPVSPYLCRYSKIERQKDSEGEGLKTLVNNACAFMDSSVVEKKLQHLFPAETDGSFTKHYLRNNPDGAVRAFPYYARDFFPKVLAFRRNDSMFWNEAIQNFVHDKRRKDPIFRELYAAPPPPFAKQFQPLDLLIRTKNLQEIMTSGVASVGRRAARRTRFFANGEEALLLRFFQAACPDEGWRAEVEYVDSGERQIVSLTELVKEFRLAYACTIHASQGSTMRAVIFYTTGIDYKYGCAAQLAWVAVSRASEKLIYIGSDDVDLKRKTNFSTLFLPRCLTCGRRLPAETETGTEKKVVIQCTECIESFIMG